MSQALDNKTLQQIMSTIEEVINANTAPISGLSIKYQFEISGDDEGTYQLLLQDGKASIVEGAGEGVQCTLKMSFKNFKKFLAGKLNGTAAFMMGKLKIDGDITKALKLESLLKEYNFD